MAGTENIKEALKLVFDVAKSAEVKLEDGKLSVVEILSLAYDARGVLDIIKNRKLIGEEVLDVDQDEFDELVEWAQEEFDLENDKIEEVVDDALLFLSTGAKLFWDIRDLKKKEEEEG